MWWPILIMSMLGLGLFVIIFLRRRAANVDRQGLNLNIARQQLADLYAQRESGKLSEAAFLGAYQELLHNLDADMRENLTESDNVSEAGRPGRALVIATVSAFVLLAVPALYYQIGTPLAVEEGAALTVADNAGKNDEGHTESLEVIANRLEARLAETPEDASGWFLLGRTYMVMKNYPRAVLALQRVNELQPNNVPIMLSYADAIAMLNNGRIDEKALTLALAARELNPNEPTANWMVAMGYENQGKHALAVQIWEQVVDLLEGQPARQMEARKRLDRARGQLQAKPVGELARVASEPQPAAGRQGAGVTVQVQLKTELARDVAPDDTVFIFARAAQGPRLPLAVQRRTVRELPVTLTLDDSMAMNPQHKLSDHAQIIITARISRTGAAMPKAGDLQGQSPVLEPAKLAGPLTVMIDSKVE